MTWEAALRFTPAYDGGAFDDDAPGERPALVVTHDAIKQRHSSKPTPVVIDHDEDRVIGYVKNTWVSKDVDFGTRVRNWWFAGVELDEHPEWLKRGSAVSWCYHPLHTYQPWGDGPEVMTSALLREISVLSPGVEPAEKLARVAYVKELPAELPAARKPEPEGEVVFGYGELLRRPNIGQILRVGGTSF